MEQWILAGLVGVCFGFGGKEFCSVLAYFWVWPDAALWPPTKIKQTVRGLCFGLFQTDCASCMSSAISRISYLCLTINPWNALLFKIISFRSCYNLSMFCKSSSGPNLPGSAAPVLPVFFRSRTNFPLNHVKPDQI